MAKKKKSKAERKAQAAVDKYQKLVDKAETRVAKAKRQEKKYSKDKKSKKYKQCQKAVKSAQASQKNYSKKLTAAKKKLKKVKSSSTKASNLAKISSKISKHKKSRSEGHAAIYPSSGSSTSVVYIAPTDSETEDISTNITSWPVDKDAPRSNYARVASKQTTVSGLITGKTLSESKSKFAKLKKWNNNHTVLTYKGNIYYKHLLISDLQQSYSADYKTNIKVTITFAFVYAAQVTTSSTKKKSKKKTSKSQKTTSGSSKSSYRAITVKPGNTLYALSKKYGKSVAWLQKVNNIKNPNLIYAGKKIRVK